MRTTMSVKRPRITGMPNGRPKLEISRNTLIELYGEYQNWQTVAEKLQVSHVTVYRRLRELGITKSYRCL